jgi:galactonate dehydratase
VPTRASKRTGNSPSTATGACRAPLTRRAVVGAGVAAGALGLMPAVLRGQSRLQLDFRTIPDPDGWHPSLRLKGDWLVVEISDGVHSGYGEASHSNNDERCRELATEIFAREFAGFSPSLERLADKEAQIAARAPDFVTATAYSALNQALYDLLAKREQVPVWRLFRNDKPFEGLPLYTTINRALTTRTAEEYDEVVDELAAQGFGTFKCAPFEAVDGPDHAVEKAAGGLARLRHLRERFPALRVRVDFHERFKPRDFFAIVPDLMALDIDWLEEPFPIGADYEELRRRTRSRLAAGELFWGRARFAEIAEHGWVDVIMPDVKHVGGFGPLLGVLEMAEGKIEVSPHNPSGPISTAASLHAAAVRPAAVRSLEYSFDRQLTRRATGETIEHGVLRLLDRPGWGVRPPV